MVKVIWHKTTSPSADRQFNCICQLVPMCPSMKAHWHHLVNTNELLLPLAHPSPQPKGQIDRFSCFCTADGTKSLYFTMDAPFPKNCPFQWGSGPPSNMIPWAHPSTQPKWHLNCFLHRWPQSVCILYNGMVLSPSKLPLPMGDLFHLPGPTRVLNPNGILIASAVLAGLTSVTDQQTTLLGRQQ